MNKTLLESQEGVPYFTSPALSMISAISSVALHSVQNPQTLQRFLSPLYIMSWLQIVLLLMKWRGERALRTDSSIARRCLQDVLNSALQIYTRYSPRCVALVSTFDLRVAHLSSSLQAVHLFQLSSIRSPHQILSSVSRSKDMTLRCN